MSEGLDPLAVARFNQLYKRGWKLSRSYMLFGAGGRKAPLNWWAKWRLRRAIASFQDALSIVPESWQSLWALGKIHQRLGNALDASKSFAAAYRVNPEEVDVAREAAIAALNLGHPDEALVYTRTALRHAPSDAGLMANLAVSLILLDDTRGALDAVNAARRLDPGDHLTQGLAAHIAEVVAGRRPLPKTMRDLERALS